jgi:HEAT repeat protein
LHSCIALLAIVLIAATSGVGCRRADEGLVEDLQLQVWDTDPDVRESAVKALGNLRSEGKSAIPEVIQALSDESGEVRARAAYAAAKFGPDAADAIPLLVKSLRDSDPLVREAAAYALPAMGPDAEAALPDLRACLKDSDPDVRGEAEAAIKKIQLAAKFRSEKKQ